MVEALNHVSLSSTEPQALDPQPKVNVVCPECGSKRIFKDGFRAAPSNSLSTEPIQRYRCAEYGHRWSVHTSLNVIVNNKAISQISASGAKNLTSTQKTNICAEMETPIAADIKVTLQIEKFLSQLENDGKKPKTIENYSKNLKLLVRHNADLFDPENTKKALAKYPIKDSTKNLIVSLLCGWFEFNGITWKAPKYSKEHAIPYIPTEIELDQLIAALGKKTATFCQLLKDTGARSGEIQQLKWSDIDFGQRNVNIKAEKNSNSRILPLCAKTIDMLCNLKRNKERIFGNIDGLRSNYFSQRRTIAAKIINSNLLKIHFHTFRHWKATTEQHNTKDPWHVKELLGHKHISSTETYIHIEKMVYSNKTSDKFTVKVADTLEDAIELMKVGFEFHAEIEGHKLFRKRE
jgi:integrase